MNDLFYGSPDRSMKFVLDSPEANSLYYIANSLFELEKIIKKGGTLPEEIIIPYFFNLSKEEVLEIESILNKLLLDVLCKDVRFKLTAGKMKKTRLKFDFEKCDTLCLFSGGVDSTLGILKSKEKYGNVTGLYVSHSGSGKITHKVEKIRRNILHGKNIEIKKMIAPSMGTGYSQLRGFLYITYAMILSFFCDSKRIIVSECGSTMYQPKFAPMDTITYTTNPYVLGFAKRIGEIFLKKEIDIVTPFENFTKTEMMNLIRDDSILSMTHSCITGRWDRNCGKCYACIARMIGSANLGLSLDYFRNNCFDEGNDMLDSFLNFCIDYMTFEENVDYWSLVNIKKFGKEDLFRRTSLDVFLALKKLDDSNSLDFHYKTILEQYAKRFKLELIVREKELTSKEKSPDFDKNVRILD